MGSHKEIKGSWVALNYWAANLMLQGEDTAYLEETEKYHILVSGPNVS